MENIIRLPNGRWFDADKAQSYEEDTRWDGNNNISLATGSQWEHEKLYRTRKGVWWLYCWSQWQGSTPEWRELDDEDAARWLTKHGHAAPESLEV